MTKLRATLLMGCVLAAGSMIASSYGGSEKSHGKATAADADKFVAGLNEDLRRLTYRVVTATSVPRPGISRSV